MVFGSFDELLDMGGHGGYVWAAYGVTLMALLWLALAPVFARRRLLDDIARRARRDASRDTTDSTGAD